MAHATEREALATLVERGLPRHEQHAGERFIDGLSKSRSRRRAAADAAYLGEHYFVEIFPITGDGICRCTTRVTFFAMETYHSRRRARRRAPSGLTAEEYRRQLGRQRIPAD